MIKRDKIIKFIGRNKYKISRGTSYISLINTMLLVGIAFHITNPILIVIVGIGTLFSIWLIGVLDNKLKIVHAESDWGVESTTPYFQTIRAELEEVQKNVEKIKQMLEERK